MSKRIQVQHDGPGLPLVINPDTLEEGKTVELRSAEILAKRVFPSKGVIVKVEKSNVMIQRMSLHYVRITDGMQLIHGDCLEKMKDIPDKSIDMILCDLPYGTTACKWDVVIPFEPLWEQYERVIKDNGAIVLFGGEPFSSYLRMSNIKQYKYDWVWSKGKESNFMLLKKQPKKDYETISVFYKKQPTYNPQMSKAKTDRSGNKGNKERIEGSIQNYSLKNLQAEYVDDGLRYPSLILNYSSQAKEVNNKNRLHPTQKPVALLEYLIKTYTLEGETVLDNCMGSGSTGIACINTNRNFIGIEKDDRYFEIAKKRIEEHLTKERMLRVWF